MRKPFWEDEHYVDGWMCLENLIREKSWRLPSHLSWLLSGWRSSGSALKPSQELVSVNSIIDGGECSQYKSFRYGPNSKLNHLQRVLTPGTQADTGALIHGWAEEVGGGLQSLNVPHIPMHRRTCLQSNRLTNHCCTSVWLCLRPNLLHKQPKSGQRVNSFEPKLPCPEEGAVPVGAPVCVVTDKIVGGLCAVIILSIIIIIEDFYCSRCNAALIHSSLLKLSVISPI